MIRIKVDRRAPQFMRCDDGGFTTTGMVVALFVSLSLVFASAQVYRVQSASAEVQDVADAAVLAAQNQVAEFMLVARTCDAIVLSLTMAGLTSTGLGIAALCTPVTAPFSDKLLSAGRELFNARDTFAEKACTALNKLQAVLPFLSAVRAARVAQANGVNTTGANYIAAAVLIPLEGTRLEVNIDDGSAELLDDIDDQAEDVRKRAQEAEEAAERANRSKQRAYERDCGDYPDYCMYERADWLAGLDASENPYYGSVDLWSFSVALSRARAYYDARLANEWPDSWSYRDQARSALRSRFYRYCVEQLQSAYVIEYDGYFSAWFPRFPNNLNELRYTSLYTERVYPVTYSGEGVVTMHAWPGCPEAAASLDYGSIYELELSDYDVCPTCEFHPSSMSSVAAASTSIPNGFEYHYDAVAVEAGLYEEARRQADQPASEVRDTVGGLLQKLKDYAASAAGSRIDAEPPGRYGAIVLAANVGNVSAAGPFANAFAASGQSLGPCAAIAGATLIDEGTDEGKTAISSFLDGLKENGGAVTGALGIVLDVWSAALLAYSNGQEAITGAIENGLNNLPLVGQSGLGTWAANKLKTTLEDFGLQPAEVGALKPVLINTGYVAQKDTSAFGQGLLSVKQQAVAHPLMSTDLFSSLLIEAERIVIAHVDGLGDSIEVASIALFGGGINIPITIPIPDIARDGLIGFVQGVFDQLKTLYVEVSGVRVWE